jgi:N-acetylmuramoyl-L-alanine amidase
MTIKFCIDPGHGCNTAVGGRGRCDPGAIGFNDIRECDLNLSFSFKLKHYLLEAGADVIMTREDDRFITLKDRCVIANNNRSNYFISVHHNASANQAARGSESLVYDLMRVPVINKTIAKTLPKATGFLTRGVKERKNLYVLRRTIMPAILLEIGFISNPREAIMCQNKAFQDKVAKELVESIKKYL